MNKLILTTFFTFIFCFSSIAQKAEKVKGNKNVTVQQTEINSFHTIIVGEDFEINIVYNQSPSVSIETDENLHQFIKFDVTNGVLTFKKTARITSNKKLNITVNYDETLTNIKTNDKGEITSLATMELPNVILISEGSSRAGLTLKTNNLEFQGNGKSKVKLNLTSDTTNLILTDNSKLEALIFGPKVKIDLYQSANAIIEGETDELNLRTDNYSYFDGKNLTAKICNTTNEISSDAYLEVLDSVTIEASGSSSIYLYGNPKIIVNRLTDTTKLQKKEK